MNPNHNDALAERNAPKESYDRKGEYRLFDSAEGRSEGNAKLVSELQERRLELEATVERLTLVLESTQYGFWDWNCETNEVYYSPQWARLLEYEPAEVEPNASFFLNLVHPDDLQRVMSSIEIHFANLEPWKQLEVRLRTKSGGYRWFLDRGKLVNRDESGKPLRMVGTLTDITQAKNDQAIIEEKERRIHESQSIAKLGSFHWNAITNRVLWSDELYRIFDKNALEFTPSFEAYIECVRPSDRPRILKGLQDAMETLGGFEHEYLLNNNNEKPCWIQSRGRATVGEDGKFAGLEGTCQDITDRKIAEVRMTEALDRLERIANRVPGMVYEFRMGTDGKFSFPYASPGMKTIFQVDPSEVLEDGSLVFSKIHPEDLASLHASIAESAANMAFWHHEFRVLLPDGTMRWLSGSSVPTLEQDGSILWYGYLTDNTDRKNSEMAIRFSEAKFRSIINASPVPMALCDDQGQITYINLSFTGTFGYSADEIPNLSVWRNKAYPCPEYRETVLEKWRANFQQAKMTGDIFEPIEIKIQCKDGSVKLVVASATPILEGHSGLYLLVAQDITDRYESEQKIVKAHAAAEAASRAKSEFLANMSHEIRTPLTAILGFAELLREESTSLGTAGQRSKLVDTIKNAGAHLLTIINDVLDLSKIEANKMTIEQVETSLLKVLQEIENLMLPIAKGKGVDLRVVLTSPMPDRIQCDPTRLRQIIMNLVGNSIKFSEAGRVTIRAGILVDEVGKELVAIDIHDTGPGIANEQVARLFMPFGQGDSSTTRIHGGTGLGLTLSRRFARLLGGDVILLENVIGKGACFRLQFPLHTAEGSNWVTELHLEGVEPLRGANKELQKIELAGRILLAEDGIDNQRLISFILRNAGATVETSDNGRIALEMIHREEKNDTPYDLLVSDMQMPEMDGYSLAFTLREEGNRIPILALTANAMSYDEKKCFDAGCNDYAIKPIDKQALLTKCASLLAKSNPLN